MYYLIILQLYLFSRIQLISFEQTGGSPHITMKHLIGNLVPLIILPFTPPWHTRLTLLIWEQDNGGHSICLIAETAEKRQKCN
jgi:hypothetical protein